MDEEGKKGHGKGGGRGRKKGKGEEKEKEKEKEEEVTFLQRKVSLLNPLGKAKVEPQDSLLRTWLL